MKQALVTGASGFIGCHLVNRLVESGVTTRCLVRGSSRTKHIHADASQVVGSLDQPESLGSAVAGCDVVFHLAGLTKSLRKDALWEVNETGTRHLAEACRSVSEPPTLIVVSSLAAAGPNVNDEELRPRREDDPPVPVSHYGKSKLAGERAAREFARDMPISIVRPPIVLGPLDKDGLEMFKPIARLGLHVIPGNPSAPYSVIDARDLADALIAVARRGHRCESEDIANAAGTYFAADASTVTYGDLGRMIGHAVGRSKIRCVRVPLPVVRGAAGFNEWVGRFRRQPHILNWDKAREASQPGWACDVAKIETECGFRVETPLQTRLNETAQWYRDQGWL